MSEKMIQLNEEVVKVQISSLYWQEQEWVRQGLKLSHQIMYNRVLRAAEDHLLPFTKSCR